MTAVTAFPNLDFALGEYFLSLHIVKKGAVTLLVLFLDSCDHTELMCKNSESLFLGCLCKALVHICPLVVLTSCCCCKVGSSVVDSFEFLEPKFGMLLLVVGCLEEKGGNLLEALFLGLGCKISVLVTCF